MRHSLYVSAAAAVLIAGTAAHADVTISTAQTQNISCSGGVWVPPAAAAVLNVDDLETLFASGIVHRIFKGAPTDPATPASRAPPKGSYCRLAVTPALREVAWGSNAAEDWPGEFR
ncbi:MAG TPA: hypothetical protein VMF67_09515 [Rhizomicrobium sp.]|nr:hypothetical protein [Rhizomicrobium sp.]